MNEHHAGIIAGVIEIIRCINNDIRISRREALGEKKKNTEKHYMKEYSEEGK